MLPERLNAMRCAVRCVETTSLVLLNAPEVMEQNPIISRTAYSCLQYATKSQYEDRQILELFEELGVLSMSPTVFRYASNLEAYSPGYGLIMFMSNCTIQLIIFILHTLIRTLQLNMQSSRYLNPHDWLQAIRYQFNLMQHSLAPNVPVQQSLQQGQFASYQSVWQPRWTQQHNSPNQGDPCTLFESPPHILNLEDVIPIVGWFCTL